MLGEEALIASDNEDEENTANDAYAANEDNIAAAQLPGQQQPTTQKHTYEVVG